MTTTRTHGEPVPTESASLAAGQLAQFQELFPHVFAEGKVDWDKLRAALGDLADDRPERYTFTWAGKRDAIRLLQMPTRATLIPCPQESEFDATQHLFIEGDNLEVLKLLYKSYAGRVKMIYIDPPYNTGNDFVYPDNYFDPLATYLQLTGQQDAEGNLLTSNPETSGRYHSAWLSMMYPRLFLARQLLREDGVIFVSIDDNEVHNLRLLMNEVFGEENFVATVIWEKMYSPKSSARHFSEDHDYIVVYARNAAIWGPSLMPRTAEMDARYSNPDNDPRGPWKPSGLDARNYYSRGTYPITCPSGRIISGPPQGSYWRVSKEKFEELDQDKRIWWGGEGNSVPALKRFLSEVKPGKVPQTLWSYAEVGHTQEAKKELLALVDFDDSTSVFETPKPARLIKRMLQVATESDSDLVLDFFAGSCTTAQAVLELNREDGGNRRFIMVQLPEPTGSPKFPAITDIGKERIRRVIARMKQERAGQLDLQDRDAPEDLGFKVFTLAESHYRRWTGTAERDAEALANQMELFTDPLLPGWQATNVIYEAALKEGYSLTCRIEPLPEITTNSVSRVSDGERGQSFLICLDDTLDPKTPGALALRKEDILICRDVALTDELAANLALQCRLKTI